MGGGPVVAMSGPRLARDDATPTFGATVRGLVSALVGEVQVMRRGGRTARVGLLVVGLVGLGCPGLRAQHVLRIGAPVRVSGLEVPGALLTGVLAGLSGDTVLIGVPGGVEALRVPRSAITHVWGQAGRRSGAARIALIGMLAGTAAGVALAAASTNDAQGPSSPGIILGSGTVGLLLGAGLGQLVLREARWVETPLEMLDEALRAP
jgi:hypothetical protein